MKLEPVVQEEMSFKEKVYGWNDYFELEPVAHEEMPFKSISCLDIW